MTVEISGKVVRTINKKFEAIAYVIEGNELLTAFAFGVHRDTYAEAKEDVPVLLAQLQDLLKNRPDELSHKALN